MATADTQSALTQLQNTAATALDNAGQGLSEYANDAQAQLAKLLRNYLSQFQDYIGESGELALTAVLSVADATREEGGILKKRERAEQDMMSALSVSLANRLQRFAELLQQKDIGDEDDEAAREVIRESLQAELDRLVMVPFGVPLLHEIGRSYARVSDTWRGNLVVQGLKNLADAVSHKVSAVTGAVSLGLMKQDLDATGDHASDLAEKNKVEGHNAQAGGDSSSSSKAKSTGFKSALLQPVDDYAPVTTTETGTAAAATLDAAAAKALWVEEHLAEVINALWRLLSHDLDRILRGAADGALHSIRDKERDLGALSAQDAARILGIMANIFQTALRPFAPGAPAAIDAHATTALSHGNLALAAATAVGGVEQLLPLEEYQVPEGKLPGPMHHQQQGDESSSSKVSQVSDALGDGRVEQTAKKIADSAAAAGSDASGAAAAAADKGAAAAKSAAADASKVGKKAADEAGKTVETAADKGSAAVTAAVDEGSDAAVDITNAAAAKVDQGVKAAGKQAESAATDAGKVAREVTDAAAAATDQAAAAVDAAAPEVAAAASRKAEAAGEAGKVAFDIADKTLDTAADVSKDLAAAANDAIEGGAAAAHDVLDKGTPIVLDAIDKSAPAINDAAAVTAEEAKKVTAAAGQAIEQSVDAAATAVEETVSAAATQTKAVVDQYSAAAVAGTQALAESADQAIASTPAAADSAAAAGLKAVTPGVITAADQIQTGAGQLKDLAESAPEMVQQLGDQVKSEMLDKQGHEGVDQLQQQTAAAADKAKQQVQDIGKTAADQVRSAAAGAAAALPVLAEDLAREAKSVKDNIVPQVISPAGVEVSKTLTDGSAQAAAAVAAAATTAAETLPQLAQDFVEGSLKPAAAAAAETLPAAVEEIGGKLLKEEANVLSEGIVTTTRLLGDGAAADGSSSGPGLLSIAADTARVAPEAVTEFKEQQLLPAVKDVAADVVELAKGAETQADLVLSRLVSSCRTQDRELLAELRGELLYMARCIEQPVSDAREALKSADVAGQAKKLEQQLLPAVEEAATAVEEGVAAAAPKLGDQLDDLGGMMTKAGEEMAAAVKDNADVAHEQLSAVAADLSEQIQPAADQAAAALVQGAESAAAAVGDKGDDIAAGIKEAGQELGSATAAAAERAAKAVSAAADAAATAATTAADTAQQQQEQQQGLAAAGAAAAAAVESVTSGVTKGLDQGVTEVGDVGHQAVEEAKQAAEQTTDAATTVAEKMADSSSKAAAALDRAADKMKDTANTAAAAADSSSGDGEAKDAAAVAAGKTAAVVGNAGGELAAAANDAAAAIPEPAAAAANAVGESVSKVADQAAAAAAARIADSAGITDEQGEIYQGVNQAVTEAPAAAAAAVTEIADNAAAAGSDQSKAAASEAEAAVNLLVKGVTNAAGRLSEAVGVTNAAKGENAGVTRDSNAGQKSETDSSGKSEGMTNPPGLEGVTFSTAISNQGDVMIKSDQDGDLNRSAAAAADVDDGGDQNDGGDDGWQTVGKGGKIIKESDAMAEAPAGADVH